MNVLLWLLIAAAAVLTWRIIRAIPWKATATLTGLTVLVIIAALTAAHHHIDPHHLIAYLVPDFGGTP